MDCPKRPVKYFFGLFSGFDPHEWKIQEVGVFMRHASDYFSVKYRCPHCGLTELRRFVEPEELMRNGYTLEQLQEFKSNVI